MGDLHSARRYYISSVLPAYERMAGSLMNGTLADQRDLNALGEAAIACLHLADHLAKDPSVAEKIPGAPKSKEYIKDLGRRYEVFAICRDVANAYKHHEISDENKTLAGIDSLREHWALVRFTDEEGHYWVARKVVEIQLLNNTRTLGEDVIRETIKAWGNELARLGVVATAPHFTDLLPKFVGRSDAPFKPTFSLEGVAGEYFEHQWVYMKYDGPSGRYLPLDEPIGTVLEMDATIHIKKSPIGPASAG